MDSGIVGSGSAGTGWDRGSCGIEEGLRAGLLTLFCVNIHFTAGCVGGTVVLSAAVDVALKDAIAAGLV
jgi:hypothetical protein